MSIIYSWPSDDGSYYLAFWLEEQDYDVNKRVETPVNPEKLTFISSRVLQKRPAPRLQCGRIAQNRAAQAEPDASHSPLPTASPF